MIQLLLPERDSIVGKRVRTGGGGDERRRGEEREGEGRGGGGKIEDEEGKSSARRGVKKGEARREWTEILGKKRGEMDEREMEEA